MVKKENFCSHACYSKSKEQPKADLFWKRVEKSDGCWLWQGVVQANGYGRFQTSLKFCYLAHRFSYELEHKVKLNSKQYVMHACDNPRCVNPAHLSVGTQLENMRDCARKGRCKPHGKITSAKLSEDDVRAIRKDFAEHNTPHAELAERYNVSTSNICCIVLRKTWKKVD